MPSCADVIDRQAGQSIAAETVGAAIADMQQVGGAAAQHQGGEGAAHTRQCRVLTAQRVDPAVERTDDPAARALNFHGFRQITKSVEKSAHRGFGGDAAALGAADPVGERGDDLLTRLGQFRAIKSRGEILVFLAHPRFGGKADARLNTGVSPQHGAVFAVRLVGCDILAWCPQSHVETGDRRALSNLCPVPSIFLAIDVLRLNV